MTEKMKKDLKKAMLTKNIRVRQNIHKKQPKSISKKSKAIKKSSPVKKQ